MSEPKICPYLANTLIIKNETFDGSRLDLASCLQDKCALWREGLDPATARNIQAQMGGKSFDVDVVGHCGLAGKP
jgi:hypothetical protein